ncbi:cation:proton antiporter [Cohnella sp. GCM10027633]|uniref:cation:proton antiporter n=1 Tax=unclassified Cohnella TaxID=2636738 RepID=UPI00363BDCD4
MELFLQLALVILFTKLAGDVSVRFGQPSVLGKLIVGVVIGPAVLGWVQSSEAIEAFGHIGVLLLMFLAGLETDIKELNDNRVSAVAVAVGGVVLPLAGGYFAGVAVGMSDKEALFLGLLLSATSVSISVQTFRELGKLKSKESTTVLGAALVDDILVVVALAVMMSFMTAEEISLAAVVGKKLLFFALVVLLGWKVVPLAMRVLARSRVTEAVVSAALVVCLLFAYMGESLGVAGIIGSFAAGIAISRTGFKHTVEQKLQPIAYAVFVPVFFASIGLSVSFHGLTDQIWFIVALSIVAVVTKLVGAGFGARLTGFGPHSSMVIGAGMISRGEVALIIAAIGLNAGLLSPAYFTSTIVVVIVSTLVTPPLLKALLKDGDEARAEER